MGEHPRALLTAMRIPGLSLGLLAQLLCALLAISVVDRMMARFRSSQIEDMRKETLRIEQKVADEKQAGVMLRTEAAELRERLSETQADIDRLQHEVETMALAKNSEAHSPEPVRC